MKPPASRLPRLALLVSLATTAAGHASPFTAHFDLEDLGPLPAGKRLADLHAGEPYTVRMIYVLPNDRNYRQDVVDSMKTTIRQVQAFFSDQLEAHGHGARTFRFETDADGAPVVHRLDGRHPDSHYLDGTLRAVLTEVRPVFDLDARQVNFLVIDNSTNLIDRFAGGRGGSRGKERGDLIVPGGFPWTDVAHELGHAFGLPHDFRDGAYVMSYGWDKDRLSSCAAEFLAVHPYFAGDTTSEESPPPTLQLLSSSEYPEGATSFALQLSLSSPIGLRQVALLARTPRPHGAAGFLEVISCRRFEGEGVATVEFSYDGIFPSDGSTSLSDPAVHPIAFQAVDTKGNTGRVEFTLRSALTQKSLSLEGHGDWVHSVAFSPDGSTLASAAYDGTIRLWEVDGGTNTVTLYDSGVESLAFSPRGTTLASGSQDGTVKLWDLEMGTSATLEGHTGLVQVVTFSPDGSTLASGSSDQTVRLWNVEERESVRTFEGHGDAVESVALAPDGLIVASGASDGTIWLWDSEREESIAALQGSRSAVQSLAFSPDGSTLAAGSYPDGRVRLWDVATGENISTLGGGLPCQVSSVVFSPDGSTLAFGSGDHLRGTIELWDAGTRRKMTTLAEHGGAVHSMAISPDGTTLASASWDRTVKLWDLSEWTEPRLWRLDKVSGDLQEGRGHSIG